MKTETITASLREFCSFYGFCASGFINKNRFIARQNLFPPYSEYHPLEISHTL
jgi:hypothetical protein